MSDRITIEEQGAPTLGGDGQTEGSGPDPGAGVDDQVLLDAGWSVEEAARFMASIFTTGILISFASRKHRLPTAEEWPQLAGQAGEFPGSGVALQPLLDRWLPKSAGGSVAQVGMGAMAVAGELGMATARRGHLLRREPGKSASPAAADAPYAAPPPGSDTQTDAGGPFRFDGAAEDVLNRTPTHSSYTDMGMGDAA